MNQSKAYPEVPTSFEPFDCVDISVKLYCFIELSKFLFRISFVQGHTSHLKFKSKPEISILLIESNDLMNEATNVTDKSTNLPM